MSFTAMVIGAIGLAFAAASFLLRRKGDWKRDKNPQNIYPIW